MSRDELLHNVEKRLTSILDYLEDSKVKEAMNYALLGGGKRIRPMLFLCALQDYGLNPFEYLDVACAIEMIHTYSLIHDDLPGMDDDDMRRGRATVHKAYDEATAILAGDGLLSEAFGIVSNAKVESSKKVALIQEMVRSCGCNGMILGQELDLYATTQTDLKKMDSLKTGCLFSLPLCMAAILANRENNLTTWRSVGATYGVFFQIQDDLLEVQGNPNLIGKTSNKEAEKENYVARYGVAHCQELLVELQNNLAQYEQEFKDMKGVFALLKETYSRKY